jgi:DNA-binding CsgD family transcriptional regulator
MLYSPLEPKSNHPSLNYEDYLNLQETVGSAAFSKAVGETLGRAAGVEEFMIFICDQSKTPSIIVSDGDGARARKRVEAYRAQYFRFDPLNHILAHDSDDGIYVARVRSEEIGNREYRRLCYAEPQFSEKLSLLQRTPLGWIVISAFKRESSGPITELDVDALSRFGLLLLPIVGTHCRHTRIGKPGRPLPIEDIEMRIRTSFPALSDREAAVCARTLAGVTAEGTAIDLGIKQTSVLTYRRRAYERLNISSAHQLSTMLL